VPLLCEAIRVHSRFLAAPGFWIYERFNWSLLSQIFLRNRNAQEDGSDRFFLARGEGFPARTFIKNIAGIHVALLESASSKLPVRSDFTSTTAETIEGDVAQRSQESRLVEPRDLAAVEAIVQPQTPGDPTKLRFESRSGATG